VLTFALTVTDNLAAASTPASVNVTVNPVGLLSVTTSVPPAARVDLSAEGTLDWAHWGRTVITFDHKNNVTQQISTYTEILNPGGPFNQNDAPVAYSWIDGTPDAAETDTTTGIFFSMSSTTGGDLGKGYSLTVSADTSTKTLKLYLGGQQGEGKLTASLDDGSAAPAELLIPYEFGPFTRVVTLTFRATSATNLTLTYTLNNDFGTASNLTLQAATLN
jgi:hypothetical protein